jgi:tetratricopeptide (TPR) repeat protein
MKRSIKFGIFSAVGALMIIGAAMAFMIMRQEPEWSSSSPEAVREFKAGLEAERKVYLNEARQHFEAALELDPEFQMAKLKLAERDTSPDKHKALLESLDQKRMNERERFLIRYALLIIDQKRDEAGRILEKYVRDHPNDPVGVNRMCARSWESRDWEDAEQCYKHLLELDPNWVSAQNHLGYIAMAQGRFREAEELFRTYRYIAPDQANPHDSLGELWTAIGRYDDAEKELNEALKVRADFCASFDHLVTLAMIQNDFAKAEEILARAQTATCPDQELKGLRCAIDAFRNFHNRRWDQAVDSVRGNECYKNNGGVLILGFAAALAANRTEDAAFLENWYREARRKWFMGYRDPNRDPTLLHIEGVRMAFEGDLEKAEKRLREADDELVYWGDGQAIFKLYNRMLLVDILKAAGETKEARELLAEVDSVNPQIAKQMNVRFFSR